MAYEHQLSVEDVTLLSGAIGFSRRASYDSGILTIREAAENDLVTAALATLPDLRAGAFQKSKIDAKQKIDTEAERLRLSYITAGAGQALTYSQKATEAVAYLGAANPVAADYPLLNAEVGITAPTIAEVAAIVKAAFDQWQIIGAQIEAARLGAKKAISASATPAEVQAVLDGIVWP